MLPMTRQINLATLFMGCPKRKKTTTTDNCMPIVPEGYCRLHIIYTNMINNTILNNERVAKGGNC